MNNGKKPIKILLIEDNEGDIILTRETLKEGKILNELICIKDGETALDFLEKIKTFTLDEKPDLILLDINLPRIDGHEIMQFINQDAQLRTIPVFMLSSSDAALDIETSKKNNAHHYLTKPLDVFEFVNEVKKISAFWFNIVKVH